MPSESTPRVAVFVFATAIVRLAQPPSGTTAADSAIASEQIHGNFIGADGGSIGSETMEVCCIVVDANIATRVIEDDLKNTDFENYSRICEEE